MKLMFVVGARPNFMKVAPILLELADRKGVSAELVHTGQHYDQKMSDVFFRDLELPEPDIYLGAGSGTHATQTAAIMIAFEEVVRQRRPDRVVVVGDVNSTLACTITAAKFEIPVAHVEAGLRSFDRSMPEEINRIVTDSLSDMLFTTEESANVNLRREGHAEEAVHFAGNVMIDTLRRFAEKASQVGVKGELGVEAGKYALMTLHRPSNVDEKEPLSRIMGAVEEIARELPVVFPAHPRTTARLKRFGLEDMAGSIEGLRIIEPLGYLSFLSLMQDARLVLTDSGGMQDETTALGIPCLTLRENTERPVTVELGTSTLVGNNAERIVTETRRVLGGKSKTGRLPPLWDGKAASRIAEVLARLP